MSEKGQNLVEEIIISPTEKVVNGQRFLQRGGVWYREKTGAKTSSTEPIGIGTVRGGWSSKAEINASRQKGRKGGPSLRKP